jgi:hypothetical protein
MAEPPDQPDVAAGFPLAALLRCVAALVVLSLAPAASGDPRGHDRPPPRADDNRGDHGITADDSPAAHVPAPPDAPGLPSDGRELGQPLSPEEEQREIDNGWQL